MNKSDDIDKHFDSWFRSIFNENRQEDNPPSLESMPRFIKKLFDELEELTSTYPVDAVANGLERLIDQGRSDEMHALMDDALPLAERLGAVRSLNGLLRYFELHCLPVTSHEAKRPKSPLNEICFQWWDIFPAFPMPENPKRKPIEAAFLRHFSEALKSKSPAVQEYGLHGFSHWSHDYPNEAREAIDEYLKRNPGLDASLRAYAADAREGLVP